MRQVHNHTCLTGCIWTGVSNYLVVHLTPHDDDVHSLRERLFAKKRKLSEDYFLF